MQREYDDCADEKKTDAQFVHLVTVWKENRGRLRPFTRVYVCVYAKINDWTQ